MLMDAGGADQQHDFKHREFLGMLIVSSLSSTVIISLSAARNTVHLLSKQTWASRCDLPCDSPFEARYQYPLCGSTTPTRAGQSFGANPDSSSGSLVLIQLVLPLTQL